MAGGLMKQKQRGLSLISSPYNRSTVTLSRQAKGLGVVQVNQVEILRFAQDDLGA